MRPGSIPSVRCGHASPYQTHSKAPSGRWLHVVWLRAHVRSPDMLDIILLGTAVAFFVLCFAYTRLCDRL